MPLSRRSLLRASLALPFALAACQQRAAASDRLRIVATTPMLGDLARRIAPGEDVGQLLSEGVDPHLYKPTRTDIVELLRADVIVTNGLMLEGRMSDAFERASAAGRLVVAVGDALPADDLLHEDGSHGHPDPHIWMDPTLWSKAGIVLANAIGTRHPHRNDACQANAKRFQDLASELERRAQVAIDSLAAERRILVSAHDAFGYFGRRFGLEVHAIQGISTESEAGVADLEALVQFLVERQVPAVFVESTVSPRTVQAMVDGARARGHTVVIGGELFSDSMGPAGTLEGTWPGMLAHNVTTVVTALGGRVPSEGLLPEEFRALTT